MKVVLSCEWSSFAFKEAILQYLKSKGHEVLDVGQKNIDDKSYYPEAAAAMAKVIQAGEYKKGILTCGSGAGVAIVANKFKGVYAVSCESLFTAKGIPVVNDANVLTMGANVVGLKNAFDMIDAFLSSSFGGGEAPERQKYLAEQLAKVKKIEEENFK